MRLVNRVTPMIIMGAVLITGLTGWAGARQSLPDNKVMQAVYNLLPDGRIDEIEFERRILRLYDITVVTPDKVIEVSVMEDGTVLNTEQEVGAESLPEAVKQTIAGLVGRLTEVERVECYAELQAVQLDQPRTEYEVELTDSGKDRLVRLSESGEILHGIAGGPGRDD